MIEANSAASGGVPAEQRTAAGLKIEQVLPFLRRWLWLIIVMAVIPVVVMGGRLKPTYLAIARIQMTDPPDVHVTLYPQGAPYSNLRDNLTVARTDFIQAANSPEVRLRTLRAVGQAKADFAYVATLQEVRDSDFIDLIVESQNPEAAALSANAHADAAIAYVSELRALPAKAAVTFLTDQLQAAQAELDTAQQAAAARTDDPTQPDQSVRNAQDYYKLIQSKLAEARLKANSGYSSQSMQIVSRASVPPAAAANMRKVQTQLVTFGLGGLAAGVLVALLLDVVTRNMRVRRLVPSLSGLGRLSSIRVRIAKLMDIVIRRVRWRGIVVHSLYAASLCAGVLIAAIVRSIARL